MAAVGRIVHARDFQSVLATAAQARSEHFALHHLAALPPRALPRRSAAQHNLSTIAGDLDPVPVDESPAAPPCLGLVVPKRHARRAVTRTLIKRQMREAMRRHADGLLGWWVVRLRVGFSLAQFPSAASEPLRRAASAELDVLFSTARRRVGGSAKRSVASTPASTQASTSVSAPAFAGRPTT